MTMLGELLLDVKPGFASRDDLDVGIFQFRMHNLTRDSTLDLTKRRRVAPSIRQLETQSVQSGDVLFNATNSPDLVGKSAFIKELDEPAVFSNHFMRLRTDPRRLAPSYLAHFLRYQFMRGTFRAMANAWVNQATVPRARLESLAVPLPPLPEQRRIAALLDHADALHAKRRQVLAHLDALDTAVFFQHFGSPNEWRERWPVGTIGDLAVDITYGTSKKAHATGKWPILRMGNITDQGRLDLADMKFVDLTAAEVPKYTVYRGDMLFNRTNSREKVGKSAVIRTVEPFAIAGYLVRVRFEDSASAEYVSAYLNSAPGRAVRRRMAKAAVNQANINAKEMAGIALAHPSAESKKSFEASVARIERQRAKVHEALAAGDALFASLQSRAFRGEL